MVVVPCPEVVTPTDTTTLPSGSILIRAESCEVHRPVVPK